MDDIPLSLLVDAATLAEHVDDPAWAIFDCRFSLTDPAWGRRQYQEGHIPGARYAHLDGDLSSPIRPDTGRHPLPNTGALAKKLGRWGVDSGTQVVAYDDAGGAFAVRLWWLLRWLGHERVAVLDGGLRSWLAENRPLSTLPPQPSARHFVPRANRDAWIETKTVEKNLQARTFQVLDARAPERFRGEVEPIDTVAGHIPGAINLPFAENLGADGRFLPAHQLRERFLSRLGNLPPERLVHSCGSGVNACHNLLAMEIAGLSGSKLYAGSWSEWIRSPVRPVARGG